MFLLWRTKINYITNMTSIECKKSLRVTATDGSLSACLYGMKCKWHITTTRRRLI